ncbi:MAG: SRPBCC family protein [Planctomycetota bacterium]|jgi:hypothetical protein
MEDRTSVGLYLEMTNASPDDYVARRRTAVEALPGAGASTLWRNQVPGREDYPRTIPEFATLAVYEVDGAFAAPACTGDVWGHHFERISRPAQGILGAGPGAARLGRLRPHPRDCRCRGARDDDDHALRAEGRRRAALPPPLRARPAGRRGGLPGDGAAYGRSAARARQAGGQGLDGTSCAAHRLHHIAALPRAVVWEAFVDAATWVDWFPGVEKADYPRQEPPYGPGTIRTATVSGELFEETVLAWDEPTRWTYRIDRCTAPLASAQVESTEFAEVSNGGTLVRWVLASDPSEQFAAAADALPRILERRLGDALRNLETLRG